MAFPHDANQSILGACQRVQSVLETHLPTELARIAALHGLTLPEPAVITRGSPAEPRRRINQYPYLMVAAAETTYRNRDGADLLRAIANVQIVVAMTSRTLASSTETSLHDGLLAYAEAIGLTCYDQVPDRATFVKCEPPAISGMLVARDATDGGNLGETAAARRVTIRIHTETPERYP